MSGSYALGSGVDRLTALITKLQIAKIRDVHYGSPMSKL